MIEVRQVDHGVFERITEDEDVHGVSAEMLDEEEWTVTVNAAEMVRGELLESSFFRAVSDGLNGVAGVIAAEQHDREVWMIDGQPSGIDLIEAIARVTDRFGDQILEELEPA